MQADDINSGLAANLTEGTLLAHAPAAGEDGKLSQPTKENIQNGHIMNQAVMDKVYLPFPFLCPISPLYLRQHHHLISSHVSPSLLFCYLDGCNNG